LILQVPARNPFSLVGEKRKSSIMANRPDAATPARYHLNAFAQVVERIGVAIMGALCGLFVAAFVAKANIEELNSLAVLFSALLYGSVGFYFGINVASLPPGASDDAGSSPRTSPIALASATGTFVAAFAALVSVYMIIFDETPPVIWNLGIGLGWMLGVSLQLAAGAAARLRQDNGATAGYLRTRARNDRRLVS
jgi:hypothetical protein